MLNSIIILGLGQEQNAAHEERTSLINQSLIEKVLEKKKVNENEHVLPSIDSAQEEHERNSMWSMVASLKNFDHSPNLVDVLEEIESFDELESSSVNQNKKFEDLKEEFDARITLDQIEGKGISLDWRANYNENEINFQLNLNKGYTNFREGSDVFGLGFSENGQLKSSDFCLIWYDLSHRLHLQDAFTDSVGKLQLMSVSRSNCQLLDKNSRNNIIHRGHQRLKDFSQTPYGDLYGQNDNTVRIKFRRPLEICDRVKPDGKPFYKIDNGTTHLIWFTLRGPLLALDGIELNEYLEKTKSNNRQAAHVDSGKEESEDEKKKKRFGLKRVQLISNKFEKKHHSSNGGKNGKSKGEFRLDIKMDKLEVPAKETTYWCKLFKLKKQFERKKYHITKYGAVIEPQANEKVVHHMELFSCANLNNKQELELNDLYTNKGGWSGECNSLARPKATEPCRKVISAWAMGAHPLEYPEQVGQSIGGTGYSPFVVLEVHYNNVESTAGIIDNSGLRFHYTSRLRPFDAGILEIGLEYSDKNSIPPGMLTPIAGYCVSECTRVAMSNGPETILPPDTKQPNNNNNNHNHKRNKKNIDEEFSDDSSGDNDESMTANNEENHFEDSEDKNGAATILENGIYIFAGQMHTHLAGVASWTEHVREGRFLGELQRDNHYSPHFQEIRLLPRPVHVAPGDALIHYCLYDTKKRTNITLGGYATSDEMCVTYLHYYPRIDLEVCKSSVETRALEKYFAYLASEEAQNTSEQLLELSDLGDSENIQEKVEDEKKLLDKRQKWHYDNNIDKNDSLRRVVRKSVSENYRSIEWSPKRSRELIQFYSNAPLSIQCNRSNGERWPGYWNGIKPTTLLDDLNALDSRQGESDLYSMEQEREQPYNLRVRQGLELVRYRGREYNRPHEKCIAQLATQAEGISRTIGARKSAEEIE